ncbi:hypothetical protein WN944_022972 [Citrus x changshan-huyou]|uniref:Uncharacterized protein n=1 Tax=Citrus x changshan-huyou TaxID=2935761 RepID=A0AAP0MZB9_9ROSI
MKLPIAMGELEMEALMEDDDLDHPLTMIANDSSDPSERHEPGLEVPVRQSPTSATERNTGSNAEESFLLGNEVDFPPLFVR